MKIYRHVLEKLLVLLDTMHKVFESVESMRNVLVHNSGCRKPIKPNSFIVLINPSLFNGLLVAKDDFCY